MMLIRYGKTYEEMFERVEADSKNSLANLIKKNNLQSFANLEFDFFDDPLGVVLIPCNGYAIMSRSRWIHTDKPNKKYTLIAEYAIYKSKPSNLFPDENKYFDPHCNDLRYDVVYTLESVCDKTFDNIALAIAHATAQIYMKGE